MGSCRGAGSTRSPTERLMNVQLGTVEQIAARARLESHSEPESSPLTHDFVGIQVFRSAMAGIIRDSLGRPRRSAPQLKSFHSRRIQGPSLSSNLLISGAGCTQLDKRTGGAALAHQLDGARRSQIMLDSERLQVKFTK
jgi:hypothetical protein